MGELTEAARFTQLLFSPASVLKQTFTVPFYVEIL